MPRPPRLQYPGTIYQESITSRAGVRMAAFVGEYDWFPPNLHVPVATHRMAARVRVDDLRWLTKLCDVDVVEATCAQRAMEKALDVLGQRIDSRQSFCRFA